MRETNASCYMNGVFVVCNNVCRSIIVIIYNFKLSRSTAKMLSYTAIFRLSSNFAMLHISMFCNRVWSFQKLICAARQLPDISCLILLNAWFLMLEKIHQLMLCCLKKMNTLQYQNQIVKLSLQKSYAMPVI